MNRGRHQASHAPERQRRQKDGAGRSAFFNLFFRLFLLVLACWKPYLARLPEVERRQKDG
jgi:hypothetical protein